MLRLKTLDCDYCGLHIGDFIALVKRMREAQKEAETCMHEDYDLCVERVDKADRLEREVDEYLKKME